MNGGIIGTALEGARLNALLVAAVELRLCEHLSAGPATVADLARRAGISLRGCQAVADGMIALKLWRLADGVYSNGAQAQSALVPGAPGYVGDEIPALFRAWLPRFARITELVRKGEPAYPIDSPETLEFWSLLTPQLARRGRDVPRQVIAKLGLASGAPRLLDIGGGAAAMYALALLPANEAGYCTQVDWPHINEAARQRVAEAGVAARFETLDGDFHEVDFGAERYDVTILSHIVHQESPASNGELLARARRALRPGGRVVVVDWIADDGRTGPGSALVFNMTMLLLSDAGKSYERREIRELLTSAGFDEPRFVPTDDMSVMAIAARR
jgi:ubiquinone/menaquinone biosynthesis C-methylase UbiE